MIGEVYEGWWSYHFLCTGCSIVGGQDAPVDGTADMYEHLLLHAERGEEVPLYLVEKMQERMVMGPDNLTFVLNGRLIKG